jgi:PAS domain S-box-containing protein
MTHAEPQRILLVEDNPADVDLIRVALASRQPAPFTLAHVERLGDALVHLRERAFAAVLLDLSLPDSSGLDTVRRVQIFSARVPIVVLSGLDDEELAVMAVQEGAQDYLVKGRMDAYGLLRALRYAIERHRLRQELEGSEQRYRNLFETASDSIFSFTCVGNLTAVNRGLESMLGWSREELLGQHYSKLLTPTSKDTLAAYISQALAVEPASALPAIVEVEAVGKDGSTMPVEIRASVLRDGQDKPLGVMIMARDISVRKALERQRTEFLTMLTHDIKNPLTALLGYADYLIEANQKDAVKQEDVAPWIKSSALTILSLVNNYLDLSRIEDRRLTLRKEPVNLNDLVNRVERQYQGEARHRRITLELCLERQLPYVAGDVVALERVLANLLYNALKFTPTGGCVTISSTLKTPEVVVTVADTGPGIASEELPLLFDKYRRGAGTRRKEGTGLGLFIVKTLVEAHGGHIDVDSTPGTGTRFHVFLPVL